LLPLGAALLVCALLVAACGDSDSGSSSPSPSLVSIGVTTQPTKIVYAVGDAFSFAGLVVTATYSDASTGAVTGWTLGWNNAALDEGSTAITAEAGQKTVAVTYKDATTSFSITVNPQADTTPPAEVGNLEATAGNGIVRLDWTDPADGDLASIEITWEPGSGSKSVDKGIESSIVTGLTNGTSYTFTVQAKDSAGNLNTGKPVTEKPDSALNSDLTPPGPVTGLTATPGDGQATLTWTDPADTDLASIEITWEPGSGSTTVAKSSAGDRANSTAITGLTNNTPHTFTVRAMDNATPNPNKSKEAATASATPFKPGALVKVNFTGLPQDETITLSEVQSLSWSANTPLTVSVSGSFSAYRWVLDGNTASPVGTGSSFTLNAGALTVKRHEVTVFVTKDGVEYAKSVSFTVVP
jgi:hypothetical protein